MSSSEGGAGAGAGAGSEWSVKESDVASRTHNPIRAVVDSLVIPKGKDIIPLSIGDPTVFGNLKTPDVFVDTLVANIRSYSNNGYIHAAGLPVARAAIATRYTLPTSPLTADDVVITSGCSGAIEMAINSLMNPGDTILIPCPGFALYQTIAQSKGITATKYNLLPEKQWEVDLEDLESKIDSTTKAILVNNPSNPCGSVYSEEHLKAILAIADRHKIVIIADEIYGNLVFSGETFHPLASLTDTVPVLSVGGIAKEFLVPGWRIGWVIVYDRNGILEPIRKALFKLSQLILTSCSLIQSALPAVLTPEPGSDKEKELIEFNRSTIEKLETQAKFTLEEVSKIDGLTVVVPQGAMYVMFGIDMARFPDLKDDVDFSQKLLDEESVFVLPGQCFGIPNYCRIVFCAPVEKLRIAYTRMAAFCERHRA